MRRLGVAALSLLVASACAPARAPLPQDEFLADGIRLRVPPPPGFMRSERGEGIGRSHPSELPIAFFRDGRGITAYVGLPGGLSRDSTSHRERLEVVRNSWLARWLEEPTALEREARARLAALAAGHGDSADWRPGTFDRMAVLAVVIHEWDSILRANASTASNGAGTIWQADAFVLVRGRLLHLSCEDRTGGTLRRLDLVCAITSVWIDRVVAANRPGARHGRIGRA
jgi:hypothetical protein